MRRAFSLRDRARGLYRSRRVGQQGKNGYFHTVRSDEQRRRPRPQGRDDPIDQAAIAFLEVLVAEAKYRQAGAKVLNASRGLDQRHVIQRAATRITGGFPHADIGQAARAVWVEFAEGATEAREQFRKYAVVAVRAVAHNQKSGEAT